MSEVKVSRRQISVLKKVYKYFKKRFDLHRWDIEVEFSNSEQMNGAMMTIAPFSQYKLATLIINAEQANSIYDIVRGLRHELIHVAQNHLYPVFEAIDEHMGDHNLMAQRWSSAALEYVVGEIEYVFNNTTEMNVDWICEHLYPGEDHHALIGTQS